MALPTLGPRGENLSIMIPNYNGAVTLPDTLHSLLAQGERIGAAQIEIVDNGSTDASEQIARDLLGTRLRWHRNATNLGICGNFNECVKRAERDWLHILHSDDIIYETGYAEFDRCIQDFPHAKAVFGRSMVIDENLIWANVTERYGEFVRDVLPYDPMMWDFCATLFPSVLVSKEAYAAVGEFDSRYVNVLDWDMWWRIARALPVVYTNHCIGGWRYVRFKDGIPRALSSQHELTAKNLSEYVTVLEAIAADTRSNPATAHLNTDLLFKEVYKHLLQQCYEYIDNDSAYNAALNVARRIPKSVTHSPGNRARLLSMRMRRVRGARQRRETVTDDASAVSA